MAGDGDGHNASRTCEGCTGPYPVFEMAQVGILAASGWEKIAGRIEVEIDPFGVEHLRLKAE